MDKVTAQITLPLPFRVTLKEGDSYRTIEKSLDSGGKVAIHPFENIGTLAEKDKDTYVSTYRKIRIDVTLPAEDMKADFSDLVTQLDFFRVADDFLERFLLGCKTKGRQFWWYPISLTNNIYEPPRYELQIVDNENNILYTQRGLSGQVFAVNGGVDQSVWESVSSEIIGDEHPSMVDFYLSQARTGVFTHDAQMIVINTAIAFEIFVSRFCEEYKSAKGHNVDFLAFSESGFVVKYLKKIIPALLGKDLSKELKEEYNQIDFLFRTRNSLVHSGKCRFKNDGGNEFDVDYERAHEFFIAALKVLSWLSAFDYPIAKRLAYLNE